MNQSGELSFVLLLAPKRKSPVLILIRGIGEITMKKRNMRKNLKAKKWQEIQLSFEFEEPIVIEKDNLKINICKKEK